MSSVSNEIIKHEFFTKITVVAAASVCTLINEIDSRVPLISLNNFGLEWTGREGLNWHSQFFFKIRTTYPKASMQTEIILIEILAHLLRFMVLNIDFGLEDELLYLYL
jgi:hypothetical protein